MTANYTAPVMSPCYITWQKSVYFPVISDHPMNINEYYARVNEI